MLDLRPDGRERRLIGATISGRRARMSGMDATKLVIELARAWATAMAMKMRTRAMTV